MGVHFSLGAFHSYVIDVFLTTVHWHKLWSSQDLLSVYYSMVIYDSAASQTYLLLRINDAFLFLSETVVLLK